MTRKEANLKILKKLEQCILDNPDWRFCQALRNIGIVDTVQGVPHTGKELGWVRPMFSNEFYTESVDTLKKMEDLEKNGQS